MIRTVLPLLLALTLVLDASSSLTAADELFVAVGYGGRRMVSDDGLHWTITAEWEEGGGDNSNNLMSAVTAFGKFFVTGGGGGGSSAGGHLLVSTDGKVWREVLTPRNRVNPILFGNDRLIVGISGYPAGKLLWSAEGETWNEGAQLDDKLCTHFRKGAFGNERFVITGNHGGNSPSWICVTQDGVTVDHLSHEIPSIRSITYGNGVFVVVGDGVRHVSTDGVNWESTGLPAESKLNWVLLMGDRFLCGGGREVFSSADGRAWDPIDLNMRGTPKWTDGERIISTSWPGKMFFSPDAGATWQPAPAMTPNGINVVVHRGVTE